MLPLRVILVNLADVGMGCKACHYGWHPNAQEHHVLPDGQGQETTRQVFHALVKHFKLTLSFVKLPDSGQWFEDIRAEDWRVRISSLTDSLVMIFKGTRNRTE